MPQYAVEGHHLLNTGYLAFAERRRTKGDSSETDALLYVYLANESSSSRVWSLRGWLADSWPVSGNTLLLSKTVRAPTTTHCSLHLACARLQQQKIALIENYCHSICTIPTMLSLKMILLQLAILAAVVMAQRAGRRMPIPAVASVAFVPEVPIFPSEFTAAVSQFARSADGDETWVEGYYYYSDTLEAIQIDYTIPGAFVTELVHNGVLTVGTFSGGSVTCLNATDPLPILPPNILETFDFLGVSISPEGDMLYSWGGEVYGVSLVIFTDAQTGALVAEFAQQFSLYFLSFDEGVPSTVFQESCGTASEAQASTRPGPFLSRRF